MLKAKEKKETILITALIFTIFFGSYVSLGIKVGALTLTLFRIAIPAFFTIYFIDLRKKRELEFKPLEKSFAIFLLIWIIYGFFLLVYRDLYKDVGSLKELVQFILEASIAISIIMAIQNNRFYNLIFKACRISILALTALSLFEIFTGIHLPTSCYHDPTLFLEPTISSPKKATGIFFNENDLSACLALFSPLFFPDSDKKTKINIFYIVVLSAIEFILLENDSTICFFALTLGFIMYGLFSGLKKRWIFIGITYIFFFEKAIIALGSSGNAIKGLSASTEEQFTNISIHVGSAYMRLNTYILTFLGSIRKSRGLGFGPYGINHFLENFDHNYVLRNPHSLCMEILGNYGVPIFIIFISICVFSLGSIMFLGKKQDNVRAVIISMDIMLVLVGFSSSNYFGIAYWWIVVAVSISFAARLLSESNVVRKKCGYLYAGTAIMVTTILFLGYFFVKSPTVLYKFQEPLKNVFTMENKYSLNRYTDKRVDKIIVTLDGKNYKKINLQNRFFQDKINTEKLDEGWHYYRYDYMDSKNKSINTDGYLINKGRNFMYMIPKETIKASRKYNKYNNVEFKDFYISSYNAHKKYSPLGYYWDIEEHLNKNKKDIIKIDMEGIPKVAYKPGKFKYQADLITSYALIWYTKFLNSNEANYKIKFLNCANWLVRNQQNDGSVNLNSVADVVDHAKNKTISVKTQGEALSVFARAYRLTGDEKYNKSGVKTLNCLLDNCVNNFSSSGDKETALIDYLKKDGCSLEFFNDSKEGDAEFRLDNQLYALIGLYDWANLDIKSKSTELAHEHLNRGIDGLKEILPLFDLNGYIAEDLMHFSMNPNVKCDDNYKIIKAVVLLRAVSEITKDETIKMYYGRYSGYINYKFYKQNKIIMNYNSGLVNAGPFSN